VISERAKLVSWAYLVSDLAATAMAFAGAYAMRDAQVAVDRLGPLYPFGAYLPLLSGFILPVWALVFYSSGLYGRRAARTLHTEMSRLFRALVLCGLALAVAIVALQLNFVSRPLLGLFLLLNAIAVIVGRGLVRGLVLENTVRRRVLVAGGLAEVQSAAANVEAHADWGLELEGKRQIKIDPTSCQTNLPRVYAAGDVAGYPGKITLITIGMGEAAIAANNAVAAIRGEKVQPKYSTD